MKLEINPPAKWEAERMTFVDKFLPVRAPDRRTFKPMYLKYSDIGMDKKSTEDLYNNDFDGLRLGILAHISKMTK